jgi:hypothetical protein
VFLYPAIWATLLAKILELVIPIRRNPKKTPQQWIAASHMYPARRDVTNKGVNSATGTAEWIILNPGIPLVSRNPIHQVKKLKARTGLRMRGHRGHPEVRRALNKYARWLRKSYDFPIRVPVYLFPGDIIFTEDGLSAVATFFVPFERQVEPFIRMSTGDYPKLKRLKGRDDALAPFLISLSHEVVHYFQWIEGGEPAVSERGVKAKARAMLDRYATEVGRP